MKRSKCVHNIYMNWRHGKRKDNKQQDIARNRFVKRIVINFALIFAVSFQCWHRVSAQFGVQTSCDSTMGNIFLNFIPHWSVDAFQHRHQMSHFISSQILLRAQIALMTLNFKQASFIWKNFWRHIIQLMKSIVTTKFTAIKQKVIDKVYNTHILPILCQYLM